MRRFHVDLPDGVMTGISYGDVNSPVEILYLHANGFNAGTYQSILQPLSVAAHVAALDMRGHGRTTLPAEPGRFRSWHRHRDDVIAAIRKIAPDGLVLAGHSMGATVALLVAAKEPDLVRGLVLTEPVLLSPRWIRLAHLPVVGAFLTAQNRMVRIARKRQRTFASPEDAESRLSGKGAFATWRTPFLADYLMDGLESGKDGQYQLSCKPEWEAACFAAQRNRPWTAIFKLRKKPAIPIIIQQADRNSTTLSDTDYRVHMFRPDAAISRIPGTTHFLPMERPYVVRDAISLIYSAWRGQLVDDGVGAVRRTPHDAPVEGTD